MFKVAASGMRKQLATMDLRIGSKITTARPDDLAYEFNYRRANACIPISPTSSFVSTIRVFTRQIENPEKPSLMVPFYS